MPKHKKHNLHWIKKTLELNENHNWKSQPGTKIFVAGRGAVRFDVPGNWYFEPKDESFCWRDRKPPDDDCCLEVSYKILPPADWSEFPLLPLLKKIVKDDSRQPIERGEIIQLKRQTARVVWTQIKFIDPVEHREAYSRIGIGLGSSVQCSITFDYWVDDTERLVPVWDTVLNSLVLGLYIRDPRAGFALPD
ncbi:hypothetical protein [Oscillatoria sp. FACHB-1406]|uniref:hypothetical protein n=1 Tax=Oscillatoria sp. FACHB-1406 TaxID=2692846 RepID=UPI0016891BC0|nr:hypothetical protein [Oscillatoria sp. FACHB-1406]MBD2579459.1 hypothetical protein [Oscillatoria sp. FACHB-1406]